MLVLTRRVSESVHVGDDITITVLEVRGGQIRLGISAPPSVGIVRSELIAVPFISNPYLRNAVTGLDC